jgi:hypothetical protein
MYGETLDETAGRFHVLQFLSPNVQSIRLSARSPQRDRAPDALAEGTPRGLRNDLVALLGPDRVLTRPTDLSLRALGTHDLASDFDVDRSRNPKNRGPFQRVPVIANATFDRLG